MGPCLVFNFSQNISLIYFPGMLYKMNCAIMLFVIGYLQEEKQKYYNHLLANARKDLEIERQTITQLSLELSEFRRKYEETQKEVQELNQLLCTQRKADVQHLEDDRHKTEKIQRLKEENDIAREKLEEEKKRSEELLTQVSLPMVYNCVISLGYF